MTKLEVGDKIHIYTCIDALTIDNLGFHNIHPTLGEGAFGEVLEVDGSSSTRVRVTWQDREYEGWVGNNDLSEWTSYDYAEGTKDTNPKDACGTKKAPMSTVSGPVIAEVGVAMLEGARKYGRHNYRDSKVRASVYYDAAMRHLMAYYEGQDIDPDSGISHITKAIAGLVVLRDAEIQGQLVDDRPPKSPEDWQVRLQKMVDDIFERHPTSLDAHTEKD